MERKSDYLLVLSLKVTFLEVTLPREDINKPSKMLMKDVFFLQTAFSSEEVGECFNPPKHFLNSETILAS